MTTVSDVLTELANINKELNQKPRKWKDIEDREDKIYMEKIEAGEIDSTGKVLMLETPQRVASKAQMNAARNRALNASIWLRKSVMVK